MKMTTGHHDQRAMISELVIKFANKWGQEVGQKVRSVNSLRRSLVALARIIRVEEMTPLQFTGREMEVMS